MEPAPTLGEIMELLGRGKTEEAADMLLALAKASHKEHYHSALLLKNRLETLQHDMIEGVLSAGEERLEWAKISKGIVGLVEQIERNEVPMQEQELKAPETTTPTSSRPTFNYKVLWWALPLLLLLGVFAAPKIFQKDDGNKYNERATKQVPLKKVEGRLIYFDEKPVANASVTIEYLSKAYSSISDEQGMFAVEVDSGALFKQVYFKVNVNGKEESATIRLVPENLSPYTLSR